MTMNLLGEAMEMRERMLAQETALARLKGGNPTGYVPGERWKSTTLYLKGDSVTDDNGKKHKAKKDCKNKPPSNNPDCWELDESTPVYDAWSNYDNGTLFYNGVDGAHTQSLVRNNSQNWKCIANHQKTAGNAPRVGSALWELVT